MHQCSYISYTYN